MIVVASGCGGSGSSTSPTSGAPLAFTAAPLEISTIQQIVPLGNLNPPGHTLPTDHIYVNGVLDGGQLVTQPVFAPGDGTVQFVLPNGTQSKIGVQTGAFTYYLDHVQLDAAVREGTRVTAGQRVGTTGTGVYGIDLGVINNNLTVAFVNPSRYSPESLHGDAPLRYFAEPLRAQLYSKVNRIGADKDGQFQFDVSGRLAGNWFLEGLAPAASASPAAWPQHLAFVYDNYDPSSIRVSIGGTLALVGAFAVPAGATDPKDVSPASGTIVYRLLQSGPPGASVGSQFGIMIVQMLAADRLRAEVFPGGSLLDASFTSASRIYVR